MNEGIGKWFVDRRFSENEMDSVCLGDMYDFKLFPVLDEGELSGEFVQWMVGEEDREEGRKKVREDYKKLWLRSKRLSSGEIIKQANLERLGMMRDGWVGGSLERLAKNAKQSIFYQLDLKRVAGEFCQRKLELPGEMKDDGWRITDEGLMKGIHDLMFRSAYYELKKDKRAGKYRDEAFALLREGMLDKIKGKKLRPIMSVKKDQILWGRSPLRLDLAGGWTDTPPYCILYGGSVVNMAVELNGQPPIQVYIRPTEQPVITIHSIDLGLSETVKSYEDIERVSNVGSAFAIPKAALKLAGFHPRYSSAVYKTLEEQLKEFGGGLDISLMVAVPKGSGLGTSSVLAGTILAGLSDFCTLGWDKHETAFRTLLLEQILTTGGGWQDQVGGLFEGVKLIESAAGLVQKPRIRWAPEHLFTRPETSQLILLYYTGITRVAKHILTDIVQGMFLNSGAHLGILSEMKTHARDTYGAIQNQDWEGLTSAIAHSWELNQRLDSETNPPEIAAIVDTIKDQMASCKLLGAGGGGYLMIFAKDLQAANHIKALLNDSPPNPRARFVDWRLSGSGLEITKS
jgi:galactokinase/mevalonate kinase-like predicted kinase